MRILIFAGTKNGRELVEALSEHNHELIVSSMSAYGESLIDKKVNVKTTYGPLDIEAIHELITRNDVECVIDSTHPYAEEISRNIIEATTRADRALIRYERPCVIPMHVGQHFLSMEDALNHLVGVKGNVLFTTGVNDINSIAERLNHDRIFIRILNTEGSINKALQAGIPRSKLIVGMPPFDISANIQAIQSNGIELLVTKDSGAEGNIDEKIEAAKMTETKLIVIDRPKIFFDLSCDTIEEVFEALKLFC